MPKKHISLRNVSFSTTNGRQILRSLNLHLDSGRTAVIGRNGVGKTTFLRILAGALEPISGERAGNASVCYLPQNSELLRVDEEKVRSIADRLKNMRQKDHRYASLVDRLWPGRIASEKHLKSTASGGERRRFGLLDAFLSDADILVFDEPECDLDLAGREALADIIRATSRPTVIATHERLLLGLVDAICELTEQGIAMFAGSYSCFLEKRKVADAKIDSEAARTLLEARLAEERTERVLATQRIRTERGKLTAKDKGYNAVWCSPTPADRAAKTLKHLQETHRRKVAEAELAQKVALERIRLRNNVRPSFSKCEQQDSKIILEVRDLCFWFEDRAPDTEQQLRIKNLNFSLKMGDKMLVKGNNGAGKTTLFRLLGGEIEPRGGSILADVSKFRALKQECTCLQPKESLVSALIKERRCSNESEAMALAKSFGFSGAMSQRHFETLSGGERMLAEFILLAASPTPPEVVFLDEPTNHLDLYGIESLKILIESFNGALLMSTHDSQLAKEMNPSLTINLDDYWK